MWPAGVHVLRSVGREGGTYRGGHGLIDEDEVDHRHGRGEEIILEHPKGAVLNTQADDGWEHC